MENITFLYDMHLCLKTFTSYLSNMVGFLTEKKLTRYIKLTKAGRQMESTAHHFGSHQKDFNRTPFKPCPLETTPSGSSGLVSPLGFIETFSVCTCLVVPKPVSIVFDPFAILIEPQGLVTGLFLFGNKTRNILNRGNILMCCTKVLQ